MIDLRSDTVTIPTEAMRKAMFTAEVGDDGRIDQEGHSEDPTVNKLQEEAARIFGKEDALLVSSGTMGNLVALLSYCQTGDKVVIGENSHIYRTEGGGFNPRLGGAKPIIVECDKFGKMKMRDLVANIQDNIKLVCLENTNNFYGGTVLTEMETEEYIKIARAKNIPVHMDCARIFNAAIAQKVNVKSLTKNVDSLMFCLSKGLSCPIGSLLVGTKEFIRRARKNRQMIGGQMRQAGVFAAAGIIALNEMIGRLEEDHKTARRFAGLLLEIKGISFDMESVQTNIVRFNITMPKLNAFHFSKELASRGVKLYPIGDKIIRAVTHRGITINHVEEAAKIMRDFCSNYKL